MFKRKIKEIGSIHFEIIRKVGICNTKGVLKAIRTESRTEMKRERESVQKRNESNGDQKGTETVFRKKPKGGKIYFNSRVPTEWKSAPPVTTKKSHIGSTK